MRRLPAVIAAVLLVVLGLGLAVLPLETPAFTAWLTARYSRSADAGLAATQTADIAEKVRAFVVSGEGTLPETFAGRPAFDAAMVSHLEDVRDVMGAAQLATYALLALALLGAVAAWRAGRLGILGDALVYAGRALVVGVALIGVAAIVDFDGFFSAFHGVFFASGTWTFPYDSLLIRLFPEAFWAFAGVSWGVLSMVVGGVFWLLGVGARRRWGRPLTEARDYQT